MTFLFRDGASLATEVPSNRLFQAWCGAGLTGMPEPTAVQRASAETTMALTARNPVGVAPLWLDADHDGWFAQLAEDQLDASARRELTRNLDLLATGAVSTVVTGQQPGFLGGPLLTLHKVATAVALARLRSEAGQETVPVFWCGDDDDDLAEALAPVAWDPAAQALLRAEGRVQARNAGGARKCWGRARRVVGAPVPRTGWPKWGKRVAIPWCGIWRRCGVRLWLRIGPGPA